MSFAQIFRTADAVAAAPALKVVVVSGSLQPPSKTRALLDRVVGELAQKRNIETTVIDLAEVGSTIATVTTRKALSPDIEALYRAVEEADLLIVGSPIYKGSYSGLFKHFFDLISPTSLSGVPVVLTGTGGSDRHALALEHQFRPLFGFFNAITLPTTVYAIESDFTAGALTSAAVDERVTRVVGEVLAVTPAALHRDRRETLRLAAIA